MNSIEKDGAVPYAVKCQNCGLIFGHRDLWIALQYGASSKVVCSKCAASGPFIVPSGSSAGLFGHSWAESPKWTSSRAKGISVAVATVLIYVFAAMMWIDFL